ncbi:DNA alkylation repair protein [Candidatus Albibeggiatoa sp. nov. NOAA]|uniref:DNA alkylation repair protein n=1 Tax=Candidatus Albibeggiatoa sp. nov. NOAA TaxID=3162724 RepID=UPI0032F54723|nr:DNA alkylation repair protein [Thiotrichaceae bacterium]
MLANLETALNALANPDYAAISLKFFKTGKGEYGEGDRFIGIRVPVLRQLAKQYKTLSIEDSLKLLTDPVHEKRMLALFILTHQFESGDEALQKQWFEQYLAHADYVNNWDLVDCSAHKIVGQYLLDKPRDILIELAQENHLWKQRIAIVATLRLIKYQQFDDTLTVSEILLHHPHDLIHKAVGWMLREVGKKDQAVEEAFLQQHYQTMPRTMLRYAIEKFDKQKRQYYLQSAK